LLKTAGMKGVTSRWRQRLAGLVAAATLALSGTASLASCDTPEAMPCCDGVGMSRDMNCCAAAMCAPDVSAPVIVKEIKPLLPARSASFNAVAAKDAFAHDRATPLVSLTRHTPLTVLRV
jgi:hypothetical protein